MALACAAIAATSAAYSLRDLGHELNPGATSHHAGGPPLVKGEGDVTAALRRWIERSVGPDDRILLEDSSTGAYDGAHIAGYLAASTKREFLGPAYPFSTPTSLWDGRLFGRAIEAWSPGEVVQRLHLYGVRWIVAHSERTAAWLDAAVWAQEAATFSGVRVFRVSGAPASRGAVLRGTARIAGRAVNRLRLTGVGSHEVVVAYHHVPCLSAKPGGRVRAHAHPLGFAPFIAVVGAPSEVEIGCF